MHESQHTYDCVGAIAAEIEAPIEHCPKSKQADLSTASNLKQESLDSAPPGSSKRLRSSALAHADFEYSTVCTFMFSLMGEFEI
jgi:hypothetical protein